MRLPVLSLLRPVRWIKNAILFVPVLFAQELGNADALGRTLLGLSAFCLVASAGYVLNGIVDIERDAADPIRRRRPLASGTVSVRTAVLTLCGALAAGMLLSAFLGLWFTVCAVGYILISAAYTLWLKRVVIVEVLVIAVGYTLRMLSGAVAARVAPPIWLLLCTLAIVAFLDFAKRRVDLRLVSGGAGNPYEPLESYRIGFLDWMAPITALAALVFYVLHCATARASGARQLLLTVPFVLFGILRYLFLVYYRGKGESPGRVALADAPLLLNGFLWIGACVFILYFL